LKFFICVNIKNKFKFSSLILNNYGATHRNLARLELVTVAQHPTETPFLSHAAIQALFALHHQVFSAQ
jgi:hypothetical protein